MIPLYLFFREIVESNELIEINISIPPDYYENVSDFPNEFYINFIRNNQNVNKKFIKSVNQSHSANNPNIYVFDEITGLPTIYEIDDKQKVYINYSVYKFIEFSMFNIF